PAEIGLAAKRAGDIRYHLRLDLPDADEVGKDREISKRTGRQCQPAREEPRLFRRTPRDFPGACLGSGTHQFDGVRDFGQEPLESFQKLLGRFSRTWHVFTIRVQKGDAMTTPTDLCYTPATELGRLIRARKISPVEVTEAVLARIDRLNPTLHAFLTVTADHARELARAAEARAERRDSQR